MLQFASVARSVIARSTAAQSVAAQSTVLSFAAPFAVFSFNVAMAFKASASMTIGALICGSSSRTAWTVLKFVESPGPMAIALACFARWSIAGMCCGCRTPLKLEQSSRLQNTGSESLAWIIGVIASVVASVTSPAPLRSAASVQSLAAPGISLEPAIIRAVP